MAFIPPPPLSSMLWTCDSISDVLYLPSTVRQGLHRSYVAAQYQWVDQGRGTDYATSSKRSAIANGTVENGPAAASNPLILSFASRIIQYRPAVIFWLAGHNDLLQSVTYPASYNTATLTANLDTMINACADNGAQSVVCSLLPIFPGGATPTNYAAFQAAVRQSATDTGSLFVDLSAMPQNATYFLSDNIHLTAAGAKYIWQQITGAITPTTPPIF